MDKVKSAKEIKKERVDSLVAKIKGAKSLTFAAYHGLGANQIAELRAKIKAAGGEFLVEKNTLIKLALKSANLKVPKEQLTGPTAAIIATSDEIAPIKEVTQTAKISGTPSFKFGFLQDQLLDANQLDTLSKIPGKDQLRANLVSSISSPIYGFVNVLSANLRNLVSILDQRSKMQGASESGSSV